MIETYTAIVRKTDASDPDIKIKRGWIKVSCAELLGDHDTVCPVWIKPRLDWGWFIVPDIGEMVAISVTVENDADIVKGQVTIDAPDLNWSGVRYYSENKIGEVPTVINDAFQTNYGKRRGFCTPYGHTILFDDTKGDSQVYITSVVGKHSTASGEIVADDKINQIVLDKDGIKMSMLGSYELQMSPQGSLELTLDGDNSLKIVGSDDSTTAQIGDGAVHVAIAETLKTLWDAQELWNKTHVHPTGMGPSGAPTTPPEMWDDEITSDKVSIPDN